MRDIVRKFVEHDRRVQQPAPQSTMYTVKKGDTLWEIATEQYPPSEDPRATIEAIRQENALEGYLIQPGMSLELPR